MEDAAEARGRSVHITLSWVVVEYADTKGDALGRLADRLYSAQFCCRDITTHASESHQNTIATGPLSFLVYNTPRATTPE